MRRLQNSEYSGVSYQNSENRSPNIDKHRSPGYQIRVTDTTFTDIE
jgi:hypothetical protein